MSVTKYLNAKSCWSYLNGVANVYKPAGNKLNQVRSSVLSNIIRDINETEVRPIRQKINIEDINHHNYDVKISPDFSDHILATGPRYQLSDLKCLPISKLGEHTSGVCLLGINDGVKAKYHLNNQIRVYHITGCLGICTDNNFPDTRIKSKANFKHIHKDKLTTLLASMEASHKRKTFEMCGIDLQSQSAYDLAVKGRVRPDNVTVPVLYSIKCIQFDRPDFTIEIHSIHESEQYFGNLIHEIGLQLHTLAYCKGIQCIRYGNFTVENSLLRRHWDLKNILLNMDGNESYLKEVGKKKVYN